MEVLAADAYGSARSVVYSGFQPDNREAIERRVWDALEGHEAAFEVLAMDLLQTRVQGVLRLKNEAVTLELPDGVGFRAVHAADLAAFFGRERGVLVTYGAQTFDLELADAGDY